MHAALGVDHQAVQGHPFPGHDLARALFPVRFVNMFADQVGADLLQPFRFDLGDAAREQARGLDQLGGDDPAPRLLDQTGAGMDVEADAACAEVILVLFADEADVA
jgi:hypothetical protein